MEGKGSQEYSRELEGQGRASCEWLPGLHLVPGHTQAPPALSLWMQVKAAHCLNGGMFKMGATRVSESSLVLLGSEGRMGSCSLICHH